MSSTRQGFEGYILHSNKNFINSSGLLRLMKNSNDAIEAARYRWLRKNIDRWPEEYNAPHVRISEQYDYASSSDIDEQIDNSMKDESL